MQRTVFRHAKGNLLERERPPFAFTMTCFYDAESRNVLIVKIIVCMSDFCDFPVKSPFHP